MAYLENADTGEDSVSQMAKRMQALQAAKAAAPMPAPEMPKPQAPAADDSSISPDNKKMIAQAILAFAPALAGAAFGGLQGGASGAGAGLQGLKTFGDIEEKNAAEAKNAAASQFAQKEKIEETGLKARHAATEEEKVKLEAQKLKNDDAIKRLELGLKDQGKPLAAEQVDRLSTHDSSLKALTDIKDAVSKNPQYFGPVQGRVSSLNPYDEKAKALQAMTKTAAQNIGKSLEGGKLTDNDIVRYEKMLPSMTDTPAIASAKLDLLDRMVVQKQASDINTFAKSGLNVKNFTAQSPVTPDVLKEQAKQNVRGQQGTAMAAEPAAKPSFDKMSESDLKKFLGM